MPLLLSDFNTTLIFLTDFHKTVKYKISWKSDKWQPSWYRQTDVTKLPCTKKFTENIISVNCCSYHAKQLHPWCAAHRLKNVPVPMYVSTAYRQQCHHTTRCTIATNCCTPKKFGHFWEADELCYPSTDRAATGHVKHYLLRTANNTQTFLSGSPHVRGR